MEKYGASQNELYEVYTLNGLSKKVIARFLTFDEATKLVEENDGYHIKPESNGE